VNAPYPPTPDHNDIRHTLRAHFDELAAALGIWALRDDSITAPPQPEVTQAGNDAMAAIDTLLHELHGLRSRLVTEIRTHQDAANAAWDARATGNSGETPHTVASDDADLDEATDLPDAFKRSGVIPLPDSTDDTERRWVDGGSGPGYTPDDTERDDNPEETDR
jgi:hypothetical protein